MIHTSTEDVPFDVLLPKDYDTTNRRYPVVYLLHGAQTSQHQWLQLGVQQFLDGLSADQQAIVVMPYGGYEDYFRDWVNGAHHYETADVDLLVPYVDSHFRTVADRGHRAVAGDSMGGYGAALFAMDHPDLYSAVGSFSGAALNHTDPDVIAGYGLASTVYMSYCVAFAGVDPAGQCGPDKRTTADVTGVSPWGNPVTDAVWWHDSDPVALAANLHGVQVSVFSGNGVPCDPSEIGQAAAMEVREHRGAVAFDQALTAAGVSHSTYLRPCGVHSGTYFNADLTQWWPTAVAGFGRSSPNPFSYRSVKPSFSIYGWHFQAAADRALEFLDVNDASDRGVSLSGSGLTTVTTAASFRPHQRVGLVGATESSVQADSAGRITFRVDLGPSHQYQQYTPQQEATAAAADQRGPDIYFVSRSVTFDW